MITHYLKLSIVPISLVQWLATLHDPCTVGPVQGQQHVLSGWDEGQHVAALLSTSPLKTLAVATHRHFCVQVSKPSQEAYQNELNIESVERSFTLSARWQSHFVSGLFRGMCHFLSRKSVKCGRAASIFFFLHLSSASERDEWLEAITTAIGDYTRKKITFISGKSQDEVSPRNLACFLLLGHRQRWCHSKWCGMNERICLPARRSCGLKETELLWAPKPQYGSLTCGPPCVWSAPVSSRWRGGDTTAARVAR